MFFYNANWKYLDIRMAVNFDEDRFYFIDDGTRLFNRTVYDKATFMVGLPDYSPWKEKICISDRPR